MARDHHTLSLRTEFWHFISRRHNYRQLLQENLRRHRLIKKPSQVWWTCLSKATKRKEQSCISSFCLQSNLSLTLIRGITSGHALPFHVLWSEGGGRTTTQAWTRGTKKTLQLQSIISKSMFEVGVQYHGSSSVQDREVNYRPSSFLFHQVPFKFNEALQTGSELESNSSQTVWQQYMLPPDSAFTSNHRSKRAPWCQCACVGVRAEG